MSAKAKHFFVRLRNSAGKLRLASVMARTRDEAFKLAAKYENDGYRRLYAWEQVRCD